MAEKWVTNKAKWKGICKTHYSIQGDDDLQVTMIMLTLSWNPFLIYGANVCTYSISQNTVKYQEKICNKIEKYLSLTSVEALTSREHPTGLDRLVLTWRYSLLLASQRCLLWPTHQPFL